MAVDQEGGSVDKISYLDTSQGLITPGWVAWVSMVLKDPKHPLTSGNITDDLPNLQREVY